MNETKLNNMLTNSVSVAQYKLQLHKQKGVNTELSILEVAKLMDMIHFKEDEQKIAFEQISRFSLN